jgi:hypothetical protein
VGGSSRERAHGNAGAQKLIDDEMAHAARCTCYEDCVSTGARHEPRGYKRGRQRTGSQVSIALLSFAPMEHYHGPRGLRQGPRASSNFALILNQELR